MYVYKITNSINKKEYIGITNNVEKRWSNHKSGNSPKMAIAKAIKKYGKENFIFEVLYRNLSIEQAQEKEMELIQKLNTLAPNGYNISEGGGGCRGVKKYGAENSNAHLTQEEAQYILDHRYLPLYVLYNEFIDKLSYEAFKKVYHNETYTNLSTKVSEYPYNFEFSNQFCKDGLEYDEVCKIRQRYANGEHWEKVYKDYKDIYKNKMSFYNVYTGRSYKLVMPEVFTEENKKKHSHKSVGEKNPRSKLTEKEVLDIRLKHKQGITNKELYSLYPQVSTTSIRDIINNKTWKHLL